MTVLGLFSIALGTYYMLTANGLEDLWMWMIVSCLGGQMLMSGVNMVPRILPMKSWEWAYVSVSGLPALGTISPLIFYALLAASDETGVGENDPVTLRHEASSFCVLCIFSGILISIILFWDGDKKYYNWRDQMIGKEFKNKEIPYEKINESRMRQIRDDLSDCSSAYIYSDTSEMENVIKCNEAYENYRIEHPKKETNFQINYKLQDEVDVLVHYEGLKDKHVIDWRAGVRSINLYVILLCGFPISLFTILNYVHLRTSLHEMVEVNNFNSLMNLEAEYLYRGQPLTEEIIDDLMKYVHYTLPLSAIATYSMTCLSFITIQFTLWIRAFAFCFAAIMAIQSNIQVKVIGSCLLFFSIWQDSPSEKSLIRELYSNVVSNVPDFLTGLLLLLYAQFEVDVFKFFGLYVERLQFHESMSTLQKILREDIWIASGKPTEIDINTPEFQNFLGQAMELKNKTCLMPYTTILFYLGFFGIITSPIIPLLRAYYDYKHYADVLYTPGGFQVLNKRRIEVFTGKEVTYGTV